MAQGVDLEVIRARAANPETWQARLGDYTNVAVESRRKAEQLQQALRAPTSAYPRERMEKDLEECLKDAQDAEDAMREHLKHRPSPVLEAPPSASEGDATSPAPSPASNTAAQHPSPFGSPKEDANRGRVSSSRLNMESPECSLAPTPTIDRSSFRTTRVLSPARSKPPSPDAQDREDTNSSDEEDVLDSASTLLGKELEVRNDGYPSDMSRLLHSPSEDARQERLRRKHHQDGTLSPTSMASSLQSLNFALSRVRRTASFSSSRRQVSMADDDGSSSDDDSSDDEDFHYSPPQYLKNIGVEEKSKEWLIARANSTHGTRQVKKALWGFEKRVVKQLHKVSTRKQVSGIEQQIDRFGRTTSVSLSTVNSKLDTIIEGNATLKEEYDQLRKERKERMAHIAAMAAAAVSSSRSGGAVISTHGNGDGRDGDAILPSDLALTNPSATVLGPPDAAGGIQCVPPSDPTSMVFATDSVSAPGTRRPRLISEPPATDPVPLSDGSTVKLASPSADNQSNANTVTNHTKAVVGVEVASAPDSTNASMVMVSTSNAPGLLSEDAVDPPREGPNPTASTESDTTGRRSGPKPKASTGSARSSTSLLPRSNGDLPSTGYSNTAKASSISTTARTGVGSQKGITRLGEAAEVEKENGVVLARNKSKSTRRGLAPSTLTNNAISLDLDFHHMEASKAAPATSKATGKGPEAKLKLSRRTIDDLCERIDALNKRFPESYHDVFSEIDEAQKDIIRILEDGVFFSSKAAKKFGAFLVTKVTDVRLNPSQPSLCNGWREVTVTLVQQVHIVSQDADVRDKFQKLIAPPLHSLCQSYCLPLKSSVGPIRTNAREAVRHLMSLLKYPVFSDLLSPICSGLLTGEDHILQESCAQLLLYAVALGSEASILKVEKGRPGKLGLVSKAIVAGVTASKDFVRRDCRVATHRLFVRKELGQIKSAVEENLETNRRKALEDSVDYCNDKWASEGQLWCKDNGYLPQS